jgi:hypothetical protein
MVASKSTSQPYWAARAGSVDGSYSPPGSANRRNSSFESGWCDQLQYAQLSVAGIPEGVPVPAGFEHDVTRRSDDFLAVLEHPEPPFKDNAVLILPAVPV